MALCRLIPVSVQYIELVIGLYSVYVCIAGLCFRKGLNNSIKKIVIRKQVLFVIIRTLIIINASISYSKELVYIIYGDWDKQNELFNGLEAL